MPVISNMGKTITTTISIFDGGMTSDARTKRTDVARIIKHFDNYTFPSKLVPHRDMEVDAISESSLDTYRISKFALLNGTMYGSGVIGGGDAHTRVYKKLTDGDPTSVWSIGDGTNSSGSSVATDVLFLGYRNYLYGSNTGGVWKYGDVTAGAGAAFVYNEYTTSVPTGQGLVHSKDDIMYYPSNNLIIKNINISGSGVGFSVGLTLPTNSTITSICEYGNYLAIACDQVDGTSVVYLWDRDSSLATLSEKIDWGVGSLKLIEVVGGVLCGISQTSTSLTSLMPKAMFKMWTGSTVVTFQEFVCSLVTIKADKQKFNNLFYFLAEMAIDGTTLRGLWKIYKKPSGEMTISFDQLPQNDTALTANAMKGFIRWGDYTFISFLQASDSAYKIYRTNDQAVYTASSTYEFVIFNLEDSSLMKKLVGVTAMTEPLPAMGQIVLKYKKDEDSSWTTIYTHTTDNSISHSAINIESTGANLPEYKEIQFQIISTGGAVPTGLTFDSEITGKRPY